MFINVNSQEPANAPFSYRFEMHHMSVGDTNRLDNKCLIEFYQQLDDKIIRQY